MPEALGTTALLEELEALRHRLLELEEIEVMRVSEELERFDSLQVLDEYAKQLEESRDKLTRLLRAGTAVQEAQTVQEVLQKIADSIGEAGWGSVSVSLFENWNITESAYFGISDEDIEFLQTHRRVPQERARFYGPDFERFRISRSFFVPSVLLPQVMSVDGVVPGRRAVQTGDTWDPMDLAYVPLYGSDGNVIGAINCDDPVDGQRPAAETFFYLELFADLAARKVETQQLLERQRHIEEALRESEERYRAIFNGSGDAFYVMDEVFHDCNTQACELWRCSREDIVGHSPIEFSPEYQPDGRTSQEAALDYIHKAMDGEEQRFYWLHRRKDGDLVDCEISLASLDLGSEKLILAIVRDITERKRSQLEQEVMLRILQIGTTSDTQDEMIRGIFEQIGRLVPVENYFLALHDPKTDMMSFPIFVDEVDPPPLPRPFGKGLTEWVIRHGEPLYVTPERYTEIERRGEVKVVGTPALTWLGVPLVSQSKTFGALVVQSYRTENLFTDYHVRVFSTVAAQISAVIDRNRSEEALRFTKATVDNAADFIFWIAANGQIVYVNEAACRSLDYERDELLRMTIFQVDPHYTQSNWEDHWRELRKQGAARLESTQITRDGRLLPVEITASCVRFTGTEVICMFARDVTERMQAETASRRSEDALRWLVENLDDPVGMTDVNERFLYANPALAALFGLRHDELIGRSLEEFVDKKTFEFFREQTELRRAGERNRYAVEIRRADGEYRLVEIIATPQFDREGNLRNIVAAIRDMTQQELKDRHSRAKKTA